MNSGPSQPMSASKQVLIASLIYTLVAYVTFSGLWGIDIAPQLLLMVVGFQMAMLLLGSSRVLTGLGAAFLAALLAVGALFAAAFLLFPYSMLYRSAASAAGAATILFILFSFVTASREPIPGLEEQPEPGRTEALFEDEDKKTGGEWGSGDAEAMADKSEDRKAMNDEKANKGAGEVEQSEELFPDEGSIVGEPAGLASEPVTEYEFDTLSDEKLEISLAGGSEDLFPDGEGVKVPDESSIPGEWGEAAAREISLTGTEDEEREEPGEAHGEAPGDTTGEPPDDLDMALDRIIQPEGAGEHPLPEPDEPAEPASVPVDARPGRSEGGAGFTSAYPREYRMRTHYRVLDDESGELYGVYYGDEGYSSLDLVTLGAILGERMGSAEVSIVKLDWANFDEVEVHIQKPGPVEPEPVFQSPVAEAGDGEASSPREGAFPWSVPGSAQEDVLPAEAGTQEPRYVIYDRRTIQPMGEYVPEGDRPRIDRLTLYRMFPEYDFKTFEIDSIRWQDDEIRIYVRGERKDRKRGKVERGEEKV